MQKLKSFKSYFFINILLYFLSFILYAEQEIWECNGNDDIFKNIYKIDINKNLIFVLGKHGEWQLYGRGNDKFHRIENKKIMALDNLDNKTIFNLLTKEINFDYNKTVSYCNLMK